MGDNKNDALWRALITPPEPSKPTLDGLSLLRALAPEPKPEVKPPPKWATHLFRRPSPLTHVTLKSHFQVTEELKLAVWQKAATVPGKNPDWVRRDSMGTSMWFADYGDCDSILGWQVDHIIPRSKGGSDELYNLQPLNWKNNLRKGDTMPLIRPRSL